MRHLLRRTAGALLALFVIVTFAAPHALGALSRPAVEKPPSPEVVNEWESAVFIARANGAALFAWRIVSSDGTALYDAAAAPEYFPGLRVQGADTDTLTLLDIPSSLNGWQVECLFTDDAGEKALGARVAHGLPRRPDRVAGAYAYAGRDSHPGAVSDAGDHSLAGADRDPHGLALSRAGNARADGSSRPRRGRAAFAPRGARCVCRSRCARAPSRRALSESPRRRAQRAPA